MEDALLTRFRIDLDKLSAPEERIGLAVSGGPDSLALLLLAATARPGLVEAATVDHALRPESRGEGEMVAVICDRLAVPHRILTAEWPEPPTTALQERAREVRYRLLAGWASDRSLHALATAHHADDQAETILMRLNRGAGLRGLAGMRARSRVQGSTLSLVRPLLAWRRAELGQLCATAGIEPVIDPSNADERFERVRVRKALEAAPWLVPDGLARSAAHLAAADDALDWMAEGLALMRVTDNEDALQVDADGLPPELQRRLLLIAFARFHASEPRGTDLQRALDALSSGRIATLSGLKLEGGHPWRVTRAPPRREVRSAETRPLDNLR